jgi:guanylate kinase
MPIEEREAKYVNPLINGRLPQPLLVVLMRMRELGFPFHFVVTATSRPQRPGEIPGFDYHFVTEERFRAMIAGGELLEWAEVYGQFKGIPREQVATALRSGKDVILRIDVQGAETIRRIAPNALFIFLMPGSFDELRERLQMRRTESPSAPRNGARQRVRLCGHQPRQPPRRRRRADPLDH